MASTDSVRVVSTLDGVQILHSIQGALDADPRLAALKLQRERLVARCERP